MIKNSLSSATIKSTSGPKNVYRYSKSMQLRYMATQKGITQPIGYQNVSKVYGVIIDCFACCLI